MRVAHRRVPENAQNSRDLQIHQTKKGNEWHFGMKARIGAISRNALGAFMNWIEGVLEPYFD